MSYCGSLSALAAGAGCRIARLQGVFLGKRGNQRGMGKHVCLQFHALRFSRSSFHAAPQEKWESVSVREILLLFMYFDKMPRALSLPDNLVLESLFRFPRHLLFQYK